jgi:monofunctional biosynthetic peptidoglycan transglycosylase
MEILTPAVNASDDRQRGSVGRRKGRGGIALKLGLGLTALLALLLAAGLVLPVPSTLMLWRMARGESVTRTWVPLGAISPELVRAVIAAEDQNYCSHHGIDLGALREVLADEDGPARGGSTIAMQTVKNVYLWHGRSYVRKALELPLALAADMAWSKRRMMEVYLNVAEFGEGLFGAEQAAQRYFGKPASTLSRREAAALAASLPNPLLRNPTTASRRARTNSFRIHNRMAGLGSRADCVLAER